MGPQRGERETFEVTKGVRFSKQNRYPGRQPGKISQADASWEKHGVLKGDGR
jgi:hypothetical protein